MNNEPVAWMYQIHDITGWTWVIDQRLPNYEYRNEKPLYTHPADESFDRTASHMAGEYVSYPANLTDEEILKMASDMFHYSEYKLVIEFARAILRKAQEK
jgi:hypothetical protein